MKILFFGTPEFAKLILEKLHKNKKFEIVGTVSAPDSIVGRKKILTPSPIKKFSLKHNIPFFTPEKIKEQNFIKEILNLKADIWLVIGYGKILPQSFLDLMPDRILNIHPSLLPKYRGPAPIQACLLNGDSETGVTLMRIDKYMDHGDIITQESFPLSQSETYLDLEPKMINLSYKFLDESLEKYILGEIKPKPQNHSKSSTVHFIQKSDGLINWNHSTQKIFNQYRAFIIWPQIFTYLNNKQIILELEKIKNFNLNPAHWVWIENQLIVGTSNQSVIIKKVKSESSNWIQPKDFINGYGNTGKFDLS